jgi:diguanylate cyclase (GGDEF)-like protein
MTSTSTRTREADPERIRTRAGAGPSLRAALDSAERGLVEEKRTRLPTPLSGRDRWASIFFGGMLLLTASAMGALLPWNRGLSLPLAAAFVLAYAVVSRVEFEIGTGSGVPTQLLLVPMLFALPTPLVPLLVAVGYILGGSVDHLRGRVHAQRSFVLLTSCWHAVGPALVLSLWGPSSPSWRDWPIYALALAAQFAFDFASSSAREWLAFGISPKVLLPILVWVFAIDSLLAPVGLLAAMSSTSLAFVLVLPLVGLLAILTRERRMRIDQALALAEAHEGASRQARLDVLTGLGNRLAWDEALALAEGDRVSLDEPMSLIVLDMDGLKLANDTRGHEFGDELLRRFAEVVRDSVRDGDLVARIGGDELGVLLTNADEVKCRRVVLRLEEALDGHAGVDGFALSASIGSASCPPVASLPDAQKAADRRMYRRKPSSVVKPRAGDDVSL